MKLDIQHDHLLISFKCPSQTVSHLSSVDSGSDELKVEPQTNFSIFSQQPAEVHILLGVEHGEVQLFQPGGGRSHVLPAQLSFAPEQMVPHMPELERQDRGMANMGQCGTRGQRIPQ